MRQLEDFRSYFVYCDVLNETEFYGVMMALRPNVNITTKQQHEMHEIVLECIGKFQQHKRCPKVWVKVSDKFESVIKNQWLSNTSIGRSTFVRAHFASVALFYR